MTKLTWDNAIIISPRFAKELEERDNVQVLPWLWLDAKVGQIPHQCKQC